MNIFHVDLYEAMRLWEADGQIVAMVNPDARGEAFFQIHRDLREAISLSEMLDIAEERFPNLKENGKRN